MADASSLPADAGPSAGRGRTHIATRAVEHLALIAARDVHGVVETGNDLGRLVGHRLPRADATIAGEHARIKIEIAAAWPQPLAAVAAEVRRHVSDQVRTLTGMSVDGVDVEVTKVVQPGGTARSVS